MDIDGDDGPGGPRPSPDDRLWRHPSELFGVGAIDDECRRARGLRRHLRAAAVVAVATAMLGIVLTDTFGDSEDSTTGDQAGRSWLTVPRGRSGVATRPTGVLEIRVRRDRMWQTASATVFREDGFAVTTGRVVDDADEIVVILGRDGSRPAKVVGTDDHADIAVLQVDADVGRPMHWSSPTLGSRVAVVGTTSGDATSGVIRGIDVRERTPAGAPIDGMLLTDVPVPAEMSGGAVVNDAGAVVGLVNALPFDDSEHAPGTGAVRADVAALIAEQIIAEGFARHAWLGVGVTEAGGPEEPSGGNSVLVTQVDALGPAATAGLSVGDLILAVDDNEVTSIPTLMAVLRQHRPGDVVSLLVGGDRPGLVTVRLGNGPLER